MVHAKHKFFLKNLSAFFDGEDSRIALQWEREATRALLTERAFEQEETDWYRHAFIEGFCFLYDTSVYDHENGQYTLERFLDDGEREFGGYDVLIFWQPFPRIGIDQRNQFDYWRDMPGGLEGLRQLVALAHARGIRCLVNYIPWDSGTRREAESETEAMAKIVEALGADGIFGDTMYGFPQEFRDRMKEVSTHLALETEAISPFERLQHQHGVWVQDIVLDPLLVPQPRWLAPEIKCMAVNRQLEDRRLPIAWSFFMGMGRVIWENVFGWWNPFHAADRALIRRTKPLLQAHADAFMDLQWQPLPVDTPGLYANRWQDGDKTVITLLNMTETPISGANLYIPQEAGHYAFYDVWNGCILETRFSIGDARVTQILVDVEALSPGCIVIQPLTAPAPDYTPVTAGSAETAYRLPTTAADNLPLPPGESTPGDPDLLPEGMVRIPAGDFEMRVHHEWPNDEGGCYDFPGDYGLQHRARQEQLPAFYIDRCEVTNGQFQAFLQATDYCPRELHNFLRHWQRPEGGDLRPSTWLPPEGKDDHPVIWVDLTDARAYSRWAGKRLPTEAEWQYAAQGSDGRDWPWGDAFDEARCNSGTDDTTPVEQYPDGVSPFGCLDMSGNVWEWTESERNDGHTRYSVLKSGSHWVVDGSLWYVASGAQPCGAHQKMLLLYPGLDRCGTIGFRCVQDIADSEA